MHSFFIHIEAYTERDIFYREVVNVLLKIEHKTQHKLKQDHCGDQRGKAFFNMNYKDRKYSVNKNDSLRIQRVGQNRKTNAH